MSQQIIEGTWEVIERRKAELIGHQLRVMIMPESPEGHTSVTGSMSAPKVLVGFGAFKGLTGGSDSLIREKQRKLAGYAN